MHSTPALRSVLLRAGYASTVSHTNRGNEYEHNFNDETRAGGFVAS
jgi:hypothetical protein